MRPADQHLRGAEGADAGDLQQPWGDRVDEHGQLGLQLVGLSLEELDALGGGPQRPHGGLVLQRANRAGPQAGTVLDLVGGAAAAQLGTQLLRGAHDQGLELAGGGYPRPDGAAAGGQQHPQRLPLAPTPWGRQVVLAKRLAGGPDRVQRVALGTAAAGWPLGPTHLDDLLAVLLQELRQAGAEAARPLDRPAATARNLNAREVEQPLVAGSLGTGGGLGEHPAEVGDGGGGQGVAVGVDADDAVD